MKQMQNNDKLATEPILPLLFKLSIPGIVSMSVQAFYNVVDSLFVARVSENALAALSIAFPVFILLIAISVGTGIGTSSLISRLLGQGKEDRAVIAAEHVLLIGSMYGIVMGIIGIFLSDNLVAIFSNTPEIIAYGSQYIRIILIGSFSLFLSIIASDILRGQGNTFYPMMAMLIGAITNIILDPFLIFGIGPFPRMEVMGAAIATVFSQTLSCIFILFILFRGKNRVQPRFKNFVFDKDIVKSIYRVGLPSMVMQFLGSFMLSGINLIVGSMSEVAIAATGIYFRLQSFVFMPVFGLNQGYIPIIGYNYGNKNIKRVKETLKYGILAGFTFTFLGFLSFQLFPHQLMALFAASDELLEIGTQALKTISIGFPIIGPAIIGATTFQAIGKGMPSLALSFLRQIVLLLPLAYILGSMVGLHGVWYAFPISEVIAFIMMFIWLRKTLKQEFTRIENGLLKE
ncbi:MAG: MATE family efflux transporter [Clostridiaceae bacterium]|nr:MATE family efflux transporter [Clostridiaceae bacterium]